MKKPKIEMAARFMAATNGKGNWRGSQWYVLDGLTTEPLETNPDKGWYNTRRQCLSACDKLNAAETKAGRRYVELRNGYVAFQRAFESEIDAVVLHHLPVPPISEWEHHNGSVAGLHDATGLRMGAIRSSLKRHCANGDAVRLRDAKARRLRYVYIRRTKEAQ